MVGSYRMEDGLGRYAKQVLFRPIGAEGQTALSSSTATVIGLGALGTVIANNLCRAGIGHLRIVDRDFVELDNLQRQILFDENDARQRLPKAAAAANKLITFNSEVETEPRIADVSAQNIEQVIDGSHVVLDGTDNLETRFIINDACVKTGTPWIYGGALGASGTTMTIVPRQGPCLRCLIESAPPPGVMPSCDTDGVLGAITGTIGAIECVEALKLLTGAETRKGVLYIDLWEGEFHSFEFQRRPDCPTCGAGRYDYLSGARTSWTTVLCGRNSVQIVPPTEQEISLESLSQRLSRIGRVSYNGFLLSLEVDEQEIVLFPTGRAIIRGTTDEALARSIYARYVGT